MTEINIQIKHLILVTIALSVLLIAISVNNYNMPQSLASKGNNSTGEKQSEQQQDFNTCVNKSMDKLLNGFLNFSDPDRDFSSCPLSFQEQHQQWKRYQQQLWR